MLSADSGRNDSKTELMRLGELFSVMRQGGWMFSFPEIAIRTFGAQFLLICRILSFVRMISLFWMVRIFSRDTMQL